MRLGERIDEIMCEDTVQHNQPASQITCLLASWGGEGSSEVIDWEAKRRQI